VCKVLTADNMMKKHWSCEPTCALCSSLIESTEHILSKCNYTEAVWDIMAHRFNLPQCATLNAKPQLADWIRALSSSGTLKERKAKMGILFMFWWAIWKERNRRIFDNKELSAIQLADLIVEEISAYTLALHFI
jgi:hypothetical protein